MKPMVIRSLDRYDWSEILATSQSEGHNMLTRLLSDFIAGTNRFDSPGEILLAHVREKTVIAVCGLNLEQETTFGKAGRVRRLYVLPTHRGKGLARSLVEAIASFAQQHYEVLTVNAGTATARAFYEHMGFQAVTRPNITHVKHLARGQRSQQAGDETDREADRA